MNGTHHTVPSGYTARQLCAVVAIAKAEPESTFRNRGDWGSEALTAARFLAWFRERLHVKISTLGGDSRNGYRKLRWQYQTELLRDAWKLSGRSDGKQLMTPEVRERLGADHVHHYMNGTTRVCRDPDCDSPR